MRSHKKEIEKKMLIKKTINAMNKQIQKLEDLKQGYIEAGKQAKQRGLSAQYNLALAGLRMTITQQRRVQEMQLNFQITSQTKDMAAMTGDFLQGMSVLSKDMMKLTKEKEFAKVQQQFEEAMMGVEVQAEQMEEFMNSTETAFTTQANTGTEDMKELEGLMEPSEVLDAESGADKMIEQELENLKKQMSNM